MSLEQQLQVLFKVLEEYDWSAFAVITSLHPGHALFLEGVRAITDASYLSWRLLDVLTLELGPGGARQHTQRLLRQLDAPVLVAYCSREEAEVLFAEAAQAGLVGPGHVCAFDKSQGGLGWQSKRCLLPHFVNDLLHLSTRPVPITAPPSVKMQPLESSFVQRDRVSMY